MTELNEILKKHNYPVLAEANHKLNGMMNGFIDLFFEQEGRYYILDWKSNYLGNTTEHYAKENVEQAMVESNYHLQYLIYTVAVHKFLKNRLPNYDYKQHFGGVIYLFLRGVRNDADQQMQTGVFTTKPELGFVEELDGYFK